MTYTPTALGTQIINDLTANYRNALLELLPQFDRQKVLPEDKNIRTITKLKLLNTGYADGKRWYALKPEYFNWSRE
jgi:hypothetical protein